MEHFRKDISLIGKSKIDVNEINLLIEEENTILLDIRDYIKVKDELKNNKSLIILNEDKETGKIDEYKTIYKYQNMELLRKKIIEITIDQADNKNHIKVIGKKKTKIIGIYSTINRCGKSLLSKQISDYLGEKYSVVLINAGIEDEIVDKECYELNISDLLYKRKNISGKIKTDLEICTSDNGKYRYVKGYSHYQELRDFEFISLINLIQEISDASYYDYIIIDISCFYFEVISRLNEFDFLIIPYLKDSVSLKRKQRLENSINEEINKTNNENIRVNYMDTTVIVDENHSNQYVQTFVERMCDLIEN